MNIELAEKVRDYVIAHPEKHYQGVWVCNTGACLAGHTVLLSGMPLPLYTGYHAFAAKLLGLDSEESADLFYEMDNELAIEKLENLIKEHVGDTKV